MKHLKTLEFRYKKKIIKRVLTWQSEHRKFYNEAKCLKCFKNNFKNMLRIWKLKNNILKKFCYIEWLPKTLKEIYKHIKKNSTIMCSYYKYIKNTKKNLKT